MLVFGVGVSGVVVAVVVGVDIIGVDDGGAAIVVVGSVIW